MSLLADIIKVIEDHDQEDDDRHKAVMDGLTRIGDAIMALVPEVQALHDAVEAQGAAIVSATTGLTTLEGQVSDLQTRLDAATAAGGSISASDLAEIVTSTTTIADSIQSIKNVLPTPIPAPVVAAAAKAASA